MGITIVSASLLLTLLAIAFAVHTWRMQRRYTRERFAFAALSAWLSLSLTIVAAVTAGPRLLDWLLQAILPLLGFEPPQDPPTTFVLVILIVILAMLIIGSLYLHRHWLGARSIEQARSEATYRSRTLTAEGVDEIVRMLRRSPARKLVRPSPPVRRQFELDLPASSPVWHIEARDLICLNSPSYQIDEDDDWHDLEGCWIGCNTQAQQGVAVVCTLDEPSADKLAAFAAYADSIVQTDRKPIELIVAIRIGDPPRQRTVEGHVFRFVTESDLLDDLVEFTDYEQDIIKRVERRHLPDSSLTLNDIYVTSSYHEYSDRSRAQPDLEAYLHEWLHEPGQRQLAILGEYGQGKSTAALMFSYHLMKNKSKQSRVPILIELRGRSLRGGPPEELLAAWAVPYQIHPRAVMKLNIAGRLLLIFEGFDEMEYIGDRFLRVDQFATLWRFSYPQAKLLFTGRPNYFLDDQELKRALGIDRERAQGPYCEAIHLAPFDERRIAEGLRSVNAEVRSQILEAAKKDSQFLELVSRPSLLYVVSQIWEHESLATREGRLTSAEIIGMFIRHTYRRQAGKHDGERTFMPLYRDERAYFMEGVAAYMAAEARQNQISREELRSIVQRLFEIIPDSTASTGADINNRPGIPLRERSRDWEDRLDTVLTDVRSCGVLVPDLSRPGAFRFAHKSFMEYLAANSLANLLTRADDRNAGAIRIASGYRVEDVLRSPECTVFLAELVAAAFRREQDEYRRMDRRDVGRLLTACLTNACGESELSSFVSWMKVRFAAWYHRITAGKAVGKTLAVGVAEMLGGVLLLLVVFPGIALAGAVIVGCFFVFAGRVLLSISLELFLGRRPRSYDEVRERCGPITSRGVVWYSCSLAAGAHIADLRTVAGRTGLRMIETEALRNRAVRDLLNRAAAHRIRLAATYCWSGCLCQSERLLLESLLILEALGGNAGLDSGRDLALLHESLGNVYLVRGDAVRADQNLLEAIKLFGRLGDKAGVARVAGDLGVLFQIRQDEKAAVARHVESAERCAELGQGDRAAEQRGFMDLAQQCLESADAQEASSRPDRSRVSVRVDRGRAIYLTKRGLISRSRKDYHRAEDAHRQALAICEQLQDLGGSAAQHEFIASLQAELGELETARAGREEALAIFSTLGSSEGIGDQLSHLGAIDLAEGRWGEARERIAAAVREFQRLGIYREVAEQQPWLLQSNRWTEAIDPAAIELALKKRKSALKHES